MSCALKIERLISTADVGKGKGEVVKLPGLTLSSMTAGLTWIP